MPNHATDPMPHARSLRAGRVVRAALVAATATVALALSADTALASSGGSSAPSGTTANQQTTEASHPSGGASAAEAPKKHKHKRKKHHHVKLPAELKKIAMCESGGNPRAVSPSGRYRGKYQFDMETWHSIGGKGDPIDAPEWKQDKLALKLYRQRGTAPWPNCA